MADLARHRCSGFDCPVCERIAEERAERRSVEVEQLDAHGRTADWSWPRGFGGDGSVPW